MRATTWAALALMLLGVAVGWFCAAAVYISGGSAELISAFIVGACVFALSFACLIVYLRGNPL